MDFKIICSIITITFVVTNAEYRRYDEYKVYKVVPSTEYEVQIVVDLQKNLEFIFWTDVVKEMSDVRILVAPENQKEFEDYLARVNITTKVIGHDVQKLIDDQLKRPQFNRIDNDYAWNYYQTYEEIHSWLNDVAETYSNIVTLEHIGASYEGRPILGLKIDYRKQDNPTIGMIEGGIHAREWISPATVTWIINEFLTSNDPEVRFLAENIVWHIFPVTNPDGYAYTFTNNRMWRKNRNPQNQASCADWNIDDDMGNGIDLNRNFGFLWMTTGASSNPCSEVYAGPVANSEMETLAIISHVNAIRQQGNLVYYFAFHSFSQMVLVPFSHVRGADVLVAPNYGDMFEIAIKGMDKLKEKYGTEYIVGTSADILYEVSGSSFDWARGVAEIPIVYLFELRDVGEYGFLLPPDLIVANNEEIMDGLVEMDRVARQIGYYSNTNRLGTSVIIIALALMFWIIMK